MVPRRLGAAELLAVAGGATGALQRPTQGHPVALHRCGRRLPAHDHSDEQVVHASKIPSLPTVRIIPLCMYCISEFSCGVLTRNLSAWFVCVWYHHQPIGANTHAAI